MTNLRILSLWQSKYIDLDLRGIEGKELAVIGY
jgi:hypothetical protein